MTTAKTILLVDDDQELREALAEQFELHEGFKIVHAGHGRARRLPPDAQAWHRGADRYADWAGDGC